MTSEGMDALETVKRWQPEQHIMETNLECQHRPNTGLTSLSPMTQGTMASRKAKPIKLKHAESIRPAIKHQQQI
jgi:hypothetical protein